MGMKSLQIREQGRTAILLLLAGIFGCAVGIPGPTISAGWKGDQAKTPGATRAKEVIPTLTTSSFAFDQVPRITQTHSGIPGDPINVALVATETQIMKTMLDAGWQPADPITLHSSLRLIRSTVFHRPYPTAPVSNLYIWNRKQDLAFEQAVGKDPRRRHHVRFWMSDEIDAAGRSLWVGAATFDTRIELSHVNGLITHHISPEVDKERNKLMEDLGRAGTLERLDWIDRFQEKREGRNGGGDPYHTDGRLPVAVLQGSGDPISGK
jgi:LssY C-terminus